MTVTKAERTTATRLRDNPSVFVEEVLGVDLWSKQVEILNSVRDHARTAVKACHASGKTKGAADVALWFLTTHYPSAIISTAPTNRQVAELLWREMRHDYTNARVPLGGNFYKIPKWELANNWYAIGIATDSPDAFQGHHSANILVIVDEAAGVPEPIFEAVEGILSTGNSRLLLIGNPTSQSGTFHGAFHAQRSLYNCITISAFDTPNFQEGQKRRPYLITPEWVEATRLRYGEDSPFYESRVLGQFPRQGIDTLIPLQLIENAQQRWYEMGEDGEVEIGLDVARYGDDETVIAIRRGGKVLPLETIRKMDTMSIVGTVILRKREYQPKAVKVDVIGVGAGVFDRLNEQTDNIYSIDSARAANDKEKYVNYRAEMWDGLRKRLADGDIGLPPDEILAGQLASVKYQYNSRGQLVIESKEDMKKRGLTSPDRADAVVYAFANATGMPLSSVQQPAQTSKWSQYDGVGSRWR